MSPKNSFWLFTYNLDLRCWISFEPFFEWPNDKNVYFIGNKRLFWQIIRIVFGTCPDYKRRGDKYNIKKPKHDKGIDPTWAKSICLQAAYSSIPFQISFYVISRRQNIINFRCWIEIKNLNSVGDSGICDAVGDISDMNLMADSILGESDWLNDQSLGLENTIWECLSDKGELAKLRINGLGSMWRVRDVKLGGPNDWKLDGINNWTVQKPSVEMLI